MTKTERQQIIDLVKSEVVPAIGCTEPIAVALCVAKAAEVLGRKDNGSFKCQYLEERDGRRNSRYRNDWAAYCSSAWCLNR